MATLKSFALPDLGEGLTEGEILQWLVDPGQQVTVNQPLVEVETAKAAVEIPSPYAGVVHELHARAGETVDVGAPIVTFDVDAVAPRPGPQAQAAALQQAAGAAANPAERLPASGGETTPSHAPLAEDLMPAAAATDAIGTPTVEEPVEPGLIGGPAPGGRTSVLVGYGPRSVTAKRRARKAPAGVLPTEVDHLPPAPPAPPPPARVSAAAVGARAAVAAGQSPTALAKPPVRKLARDLGVDLRAVVGSGPHGSITRADVTAAAGTETTGNGFGPAASAGSQVPALAPQPAGQPAGGTAPSAPPRTAVDIVFDPTTREHRQPIRGVRKVTAAAMVASAFTAPHVTEFLTLDVTPTMELRDRVAALPEFRDLKVSPLLFVARALLLAVRRNPMVNSTWDEAAQQIVVKDYVNLGIAAATPRGLIVPNIRDAGRLSLVELARALDDLTATARAGRTEPAAMQGGTITITNVGSFGVDNGTPILNPGEAAILCLGAIGQRPWVHEGQLAVRQVTQLSLSFDHRIIDGQLGSQFLADLGRVLADPTLAVAWS